VEVNINLLQYFAMSNQFLAKAHQEILEGKKTCRLHRKSPSAFNEISCWTVMRRQILVSGYYWPNSPQNRHVAVPAEIILIFFDVDLGTKNRHLLGYFRQA
jgi:hypothetical protein